MVNNGYGGDCNAQTDRDCRDGGGGQGVEILPSQPRFTEKTDLFISISK